MPDELTPPDIDTSATESAPVTPGAAPVAPAYNQPSVGTRILGALSGGLHNTSYQVDPTTGKMQTVTDPNVRKPGAMFASMLQGMLTGLAGGMDDQHRGHGGLAAFAGGAQASMAQQQQQDQQKRAAAQQAFENGQQAQTSNVKQQEFRASMIKSHDEHLASTFDVARKGAEMTQQDAKDSEALKTSIQNTPGSKYLGFHKASLNDTISALNDPTERAQWMDWKGKNQIGSHPMFEPDENGIPKLLGNEFYHMEPKYDDKPTETATPWHEEKVDPKTGISSFVTHSIPPGQITNAEARAINTKPLTGAITPAVQFKAGEKKDEMRHQETMEDIRQRGEWARLAQSQANKIDLATKEGSIMNDGDMKTLAHGFANYHGDVKDLNRMLAKHPEIRNDITAENPNFDERTFVSSQKAMNDYMGGGKSFQAIRAGDTTMQHLGSLYDLVKGLPQTSNVQALNRAIGTLARQTGNPQINSYNTLVEAVNEERGRALAGGKADAESLKKGREPFDASKGPTALKAAIETAAHINGQALHSYADIFQRTVPGATDMQFGPNLSADGEAAAKKFGLDNPFNYGQGPKPLPGGNASVTQTPTNPKTGKPIIMEQFLKMAGGDNAKAWEIAKKRGWTP